GLWIGRGAAPGVPPAGPGLKTVTWTTAPEARSAAGMSTASCPPLSNRVVRLEPFQRTTDERTKLLPVTVRIAPPALPASTRLGISAPRDGTGLLIVKACPAEVPPPGAELSTVTVTVPPSRRSPAAIDRRARVVTRPARTGGLSAAAGAELGRSLEGVQRVARRSTRHPHVHVARGRRG